MDFSLGSPSLDSCLPHGLPLGLCGHSPSPSRPSAPTSSERGTSATLWLKSREQLGFSGMRFFVSGFRLLCVFRGGQGTSCSLYNKLPSSMLTIHFREHTGSMVLASHVPVYLHVCLHLPVCIGMWRFEVDVGCLP